MEQRRPSRRAVSAPMQLQVYARDTPPPNSLVETLYHHPCVKIVSFIASNEIPPEPVNGNGSGRRTDERRSAVSLYPQLERTIAIGPFRMYRAPGSVAFLSCGSALQPILPKSQCWCIEEASSKFVLQIRRPNFWRLELPHSSPEDHSRCHMLKDALCQVLRFDRTECPFERGFSVELPPQPETPKRMKPWTLSPSHPRQVTSESSLFASNATKPESTIPPVTNAYADYYALGLRHEPYCPTNRKAETSAHIELGSQIAPLYTEQDFVGAANDAVGDSLSCESRTQSDGDGAVACVSPGLLLTNAPHDVSMFPLVDYCHNNEQEMASCTNLLGEAQTPQNNALINNHRLAPPSLVHEPAVAGELAGDTCSESRVLNSNVFVSGGSVDLPPQLKLLVHPVPKCAHESSPSRPMGLPSTNASSMGSPDSFYSASSWHLPFEHLTYSRSGRQTEHLKTSTESWEGGWGRPHVMNGLKRNNMDTADGTDQATYDSQGLQGRDVFRTQTEPRTSRQRRRRLAHTNDSSQLCQRKSPSIKSMPLAIVVRACEVPLWATSHLIAVMLMVVAKISTRECRGLVYGHNKDGQHAYCMELFTSQA